MRGLETCRSAAWAGMEAEDCSDLSEAISMTKRYFTSERKRRS